MTVRVDQLGRSEKQCHQCGILLDLDKFLEYKNGSGHTRWRRVCKECRLADGRKKYSESMMNPDKQAYMAERRKRASEVRIGGTFGLTKYEFEKMRSDQDDLCAICGKPETRTRNGKVLRLCIDHDAETGQIRGLLCSKCNVGIGMLDHDKILLEQAVRYLDKYETGGQ